MRIPFCEQCGVQCQRGKNESEAQFNRRRFCSRPCVRAYQIAHPEEFNHRPAPADMPPRILREWPAEERFDRPKMQKQAGAGNFVRFNPHMARWI